MSVDMTKLRAALRLMSRGDLLIVAERAAGLVPAARLGQLVGDRVRRDRRLARRVLRGLRRRLAELMQQSKGTEAFIAEFDRLLRECIRAAKKPCRPPVRAAFEVLFGLLRHIDECHDDVIFFADEGGSWQVGVDWHTALPAYFHCLAGGASAEEYAREVERTIADFAAYERPRHLVAARRVASAEQKASPAASGARL